MARAASLSIAPPRAFGCARRGFDPIDEDGAVREYMDARKPDAGTPAKFSTPGEHLQDDLHTLP